MFRKPIPDESLGDEMMGRALRALSNPQVSPDFNQSIHSALRRANPNLRGSLWPSLRAAAAGLSVSFAVTLALLSLFGGSSAIVSQSNHQVVNQTPGSSDAMETLVERTNLTSASIRTLLQPSPAPQPSLPTAPGTGPGVQSAPTTHVRGA